MCVFFFFYITRSNKSFTKLSWTIHLKKLFWLGFCRLEKSLRETFFDFLLFPCFCWWSFFSSSKLKPVLRVCRLFFRNKKISLARFFSSSSLIFFLRLHISVIKESFAYHLFLKVIGWREVAKKCFGDGILIKLEVTLVRCIYFFIFFKKVHNSFLELFFACLHS